MSYDNLSCVSQNLFKFDQVFTGEERRIPFIFDDFHFCRSRFIGLDMTENRIFTLCRMITWVVFLRMFWNFISSLPVKRVGSLSFLVGTIGNVLIMEIGWTDVGSGGYILVGCAHINTSSIHIWVKVVKEIIKIIKKISIGPNTNYTPAPRRGRGVYCFTSVRPSVHPRYFSSHFSQ
jgi:hypothetical protein